MKLQKTLLVSAVCSALSLAAFNAQAIGTAAGTDITNTASLQYTVGSSSTLQTADSNAEVFEVDVLIDFTIERTDGDVVHTSALDTTDAIVAKVTLSNESNTAANFDLSATNLATASADTFYTTLTEDFDVSSVRFYLDADKDGSLDATELAAGAITTTDFIAAGTDSAAVTANSLQLIALVDVASGIPSDVVDLDVAQLDIEANAAAVDTDGDSTDDGIDLTTDDRSTADTAAIEVVFADGATAGNLGDNSEIVTDGLQITIPTLVDPGPGGNNQNFVKTATVISDPFNGTTNPKAIPGAVVEYSITVANTGSNDADSVVITDVLQSDVTFVAGSVLIDLDPTDGVAAGAPGSPDAPDQSASFDAASSTLTVDLDTLSAGPNAGDDETNVITFRVTIN